MVAIVKPGRSLSKILNYNEHKTKIVVDPDKQTRAAVLIHSSGYAQDTDRLSFTDKLGTLQKLTELNERTKVNSIHISLNFHPSEKDLPQDQLRAITETYMQKLGFGDQPYLVYQHHDSSHPHLHIVTTNIRYNGKRIKLHNIGRDKSEKARRAVEHQFGLVKADDHQRKQAFDIKPVNVTRLLYGKSPETGTKRAITNVLDQVLPQYRFTSLPELNAVLKNYNVVAHQGGKGSRTFQRNGLYYQVLGQDGKPAGVPIPASDFYNKPTMAHLQQLFSVNELERQPFKRRVKNAIDLALLKQPTPSIQQLQERLQKEGIQLMMRQNDQGVIYGATYIDHQKKCVFNGSDLGKEYSANRIQQRCQVRERQSEQYTLQQPPAQTPKLPTQQRTAYQLPTQHITQPPTSTDYTHSTDKQPATDQGSLPAELRTDPRKRKRKKLKH
ncbi:relaxase/mobilization nuclease domain-containing protein [Paraflavitalea pollutisoli]|uniref:relaxase/mobilization nuclease domain-containing protein n=1 Tax=Paraflavitalea pollutisoli TaxID=3034143 RepID=UPI0023EBBB62|nr:relaxase/mobilization nuclease domain-containing protein [Paraflavitalea sp. H1-2-19X]